jgi:RHS repeat-associated protein
MARSRPLGVERDFAWAPTDDPGRATGPDPGALYSAGRSWTPAGFTAMGHLLTINVATGDLTISAFDHVTPYYASSLRVGRSWDAQEQFVQFNYLHTHPNTDPRPHLFGNWQLQQEAQVSTVWDRAYGEILVSDGVAGSYIGYREDPYFEVHCENGAVIEERLRAYGVPGRTLADLGWTFQAGDLLLRSRQGNFSLLTGRFQPETMLDPVDLSLWRFDPMLGSAQLYTSRYAYNQLIDIDGMRETTIPVVVSVSVDALGHMLTFHPAEPHPPYRTWLLEDGSGRRCRLDLEATTTYLDGNLPGVLAKAYMVSRLTDEITRDAVVTGYTYDESRLVGVTYPGNQGASPRRYAYEYDERGALISITDPVGDRVMFSYFEDDHDVDDRLVPRLKVTRIEDGDGNRIEYAYDPDRRTTRATMTGAPGGKRTVDFVYEEDDGDTKQRFITSQSVNVTSGFSGQQDVTTQWRYSSDGRFLLQGVVDPLNNVTAFEYNTYNQVTAVIDALGHRSDQSYDVSTAPSDSNPNRYDLLKTLEQNADIDGTPISVETSYTWARYDGASSPDPHDVSCSTHRLRSRTDALGQTTVFDYDDAGNSSPLRPSRITDPVGNATDRTYDDRGAVISETDAEGSTSRWTFDDHGRLLTVTDPNGNERKWRYDLATGWLLAATDAFGAAGDPAHSVRFTWNAAGQRIRDTDAVGAVTEYEYRPSKRLHAITEYDPAPRITRFLFGASGEILELEDPAGNVTALKYDEAGRIYQLVRANGETVRFARDAAGRVTAMTDANGSVTAYSYDALGRLVRVREPSWQASTGPNPGKDIHISYDFLGRRLRVSDSELGADFVLRYDAKGNVVRRDNPDGSRLLYEYNARNDLVRLHDGVGVIDLAFKRDRAGHLVSVTDSPYLDPSRTFRYARTFGTQIDNLYGIAYDSSTVMTAFEYDADQQLILANHTHSGTGIASYSYIYRDDGLIGGEQGTRNIQYDYDGRKQLVREGPHLTDAYDAAGNRLWRAASVPPVLNQAKYDSGNRLLRGEDGATFNYDSNGNLLRRTSPAGQTIEYTYDGANRLREVTDGVRVISYLYDADGRLIARNEQAGQSVRRRRYRYANRSLLAELGANGQVLLLYTRDDEGRLLRRRSGAAPSPAPSKDPHSLFYLGDGLGSVVHLVDWDGKTHFTANYDAWGKATATGALAASETFRYRSGYVDTATHLVNFGARWYDPTLGRWLAEDQLLTTTARTADDALPFQAELSNLYRYVFNNPLGLWDPSGLNAQLPKGWPPPPGWNKGFRWEKPNGKLLRDPSGNDWSWHPEDSEHNDHWDKFEAGRRGDHVRLDRDGKPLGDRAFKPKKGERATEEEEEESDAGDTAKKIIIVGALAGLAVLAAPEEGAAAAGWAAWRFLTWAF